MCLEEWNGMTSGIAAWIISLTQPIQLLVVLDIVSHHEVVVINLLLELGLQCLFNVHSCLTHSCLLSGHDQPTCVSCDLPVRAPGAVVFLLE